MVQYAKYESPLGPLLLEGEGDTLTGLWINRPVPESAVFPEEIPVLCRTASWLDAYFRGAPREVDIPLAPRGTAFQQLVWQRLRKIPCGQTDTYGAIAREIAVAMGKEKMSAQAVGQAVGKNPISILIPCHRVVGAKGQLTGYAGGMENKIWLLRHEGGYQHDD